MSTPLLGLIVDAEGKAASLTTAIQNFVGYIKGVKAAVEQCEAELERQRRAAGEEVARLQREIEQTRRDQRDAERELAEVRRTLEREKREIGAEKARFKASLEAFEAGARP
jgi:peptidoglycan hydrolase CwlO-like protein